MVVVSLFAVVGYLFISFLISAWIIRTFAGNRLSRNIQKNVYLFPVVPVLAVVNGACHALDRLRKWLRYFLVRAFEKTTGHKLRRRKRIYFY